MFQIAEVRVPKWLRLYKQIDRKMLKIPNEKSRHSPVTSVQSEDVFLLTDRENSCVKLHSISTGLTELVWRDKTEWAPENVLAFKDAAGNAIAVLEKNADNHYLRILRSSSQKQSRLTWYIQDTLALPEQSFVCFRIFSYL